MMKFILIPFLILFSVESFAQLTSVSYPLTQVVSATASTTHSTNVDTLIGSMTITPEAGTYKVEGNLAATSNSSGAALQVSVYAGGVLVEASKISQKPQTAVGLSTLSVPFQYSPMAVVTVNGSQAIELRWQISAGTATTTNRTMIITRSRTP